MTRQRIYTNKRIMVADTMKTALSCAKHIPVYIFYTPIEAEAAVKNWLGPRHIYMAQANGDLGERMQDALQKLFGMGVDHAVIIGTDLSGLNSALFTRAFHLLKRHDVVLSPATDGGYYLIGAKTVHPELFYDIPWSTEEVLPRTLRVLKRLGLSYKLLPEQRDLDTVEDLYHYSATATIR